MQNSKSISIRLMKPRNTNAAASASALILLLLLFVAVPNIMAQLSLTVTNTADDGVGSLRNAVLLANLATTNDTISFNIPMTDANCANGVCTIFLTSGDLSINDAATFGTLVINGTSANALRVSGSNQTRIFYIDTGANLTFSNLTLTGGNGRGALFGRLGGAVCNFGTLTITNSIVNGNTAIESGGGIYNQSGTVRVTNSVISSNTVTSNSGGGSTGGGGVYTNFGTFELINSTVSGNSVVNFGGGIFLINGSVTIRNSTVSGNSADGLEGAGGGVDNSNATLNIFDSTITNNRATNDSVNNGGGIWSNSTTNIRNTIVAGNTVVNAASAPDIRVVSGTFTSNGTNLIGSTANTGGAIAFLASDILNQNARLAPLGSNGGATPTHRLLAGSPAIDRGSAFGLMIDQRGAPRPIDNPNAANAFDGSDIGAFEAAANPTAARVSVAGRIMTQKGVGISKAVVTMIDAEGNRRRAVTTSSGFYQFDNVTANSFNAFSASSKRFTFSGRTQIRFIVDETENIDFVADNR